MKQLKGSPAGFGVIAICAAFVFSIMWMVAALGDASWVIGENTLSDLGVSDVQITADLFMYACMIVGVLTVIFGIGKAGYETGCNRAGGILVIIAGIFLILVGYFNKDYGNGDIHLAAAYLFFIFLALSVFVTAFGDWAEGKTLAVAYSIIATVICIGCFAFESLALTEAVAVICGLGWFVAQGIKLSMSKA